MTRAIILVLDSFGIGATADAEAFGDAGADTFGHIAEARAAAGRPLQLPNLERLGLFHAAQESTGSFPAGYAGCSAHPGTPPSCRAARIRPAGTGKLRASP